MEICCNKSRTSQIKVESAWGKISFGMKMFFWKWPAQILMKAWHYDLDGNLIIKRSCLHDWSSLSILLGHHSHRLCSQTFIFGLYKNYSGVYVILLCISLTSDYLLHSSSHALARPSTTLLKWRTTSTRNFWDFFVDFSRVKFFRGFLLIHAIFAPQRWVAN